MSDNESAEETTVAPQQPKEVSFEDLRPNLEPISKDSKLLIPKADAYQTTGQEWLRYHCIQKTKVRVLCTDDRLFEGHFHCIDSEGNIILTDAWWINGGYTGKDRKPVGLSLYTKKWIKTVYFPTPTDSKDTEAGQEQQSAQTQST